MPENINGAIWTPRVVIFLIGVIFFGILCPAPSALSYSTFSLGVNDCFERVSVGKRLNGSDVSRSIGGKTLKQCDIECERKVCNAYAFGIGPNNDGTCEISFQLPKSPPNDDPDYDLFIRVIQCRQTNLCFKRLVEGRRLIDRYIRRTFPCDSLLRCQLACSMEREFICEGFNYRYASGSGTLNSCELTAMPSSHLDLTLDLSSDPEYDFYERDVNGPPACGYNTYNVWSYDQPRIDPPPSPRDWWNEPNGIWSPNHGGDPHYYGIRNRGGGDVKNNPKWNNNGYECFVRARTGFRLDRKSIVLTLSAPTLYDCEFICANEKKFTCNLLSYRYSSVPSTDNCQLGERLIRELDFYYDIIPDRDYDIYVRNEFSRAGCQPTKTWDSDCFERVRSGVKLEKAVIRFAVNTDTFVDCELICLYVRHFTCRAFSYRYNPVSVITDVNYNCLLTDFPVPEMDPTRHLSEDLGSELYHRGSYGHGCELDHWPNKNPDTGIYPPTILPLYPDDGVSGPPSDPSPGSGSGPYLPPPTDLYPSYPPSVPDKPPFIPSSRPPPPPPPFMPSNKTPSKKTDKICYIAYGTPARLVTSAIGKSLLVVSELECKAECSRARENSKFRCSTLSYWSGHCELSDIELRDLRAGFDFTKNEMYWLFSWDFTNPRCSSPPLNYIPHVPASQPDVPLGSPLPNPTYTNEIWGGFTVSGTRCKWGSVCTHRPESGIWACPIDHGDWDYCCKPGHHCGYSEGYNYPWCYVGSMSKDQWRPCNDHYYPYQDHGKRALHWPVSYVHKYGPPNTTSRSLPSTMDRFLGTYQSERQYHYDNSNQSDPHRVGSSAIAPMFHSINSSSSDVIEFQIVEVTEVPNNNNDKHNNNDYQSRNRDNIMESPSLLPWNWSVSKERNVSNVIDYSLGKEPHVIINRHRLS